MTFLAHPQNHYSTDGIPMLVRCPECGEVNERESITSGKCAHCGYEVPSLSEGREAA